jgi:ferritin
VPEYDLGTLRVVNHDVEKLTQAFDIPDDRFDDLIALAQNAWEYEETVSESIEYLAQNAKGSELALALVFFGRIWEDFEDNNNE